ncbi:hypothetical protein KJ742_03335 [Patescibacteria group bacterium]|nr:hypothetical protein [Patescibacteria group bacterium]MBU1682953.1 hypothetical protein [Patescibacteria group bacterium]MBU1934917.1 hypothetical protein [Patescibacteria group bacterium]
MFEGFRQGYADQREWLDQAVRSRGGLVDRTPVGADDSFQARVGRRACNFASLGERIMAEIIVREETNALLRRGGISSVFELPPPVRTRVVECLKRAGING